MMLRNEKGWEGEVTKELGNQLLGGDISFGASGPCGLWAELQKVRNGYVGHTRSWNESQRLPQQRDGNFEGCQAHKKQKV